MSEAAYIHGTDHDEQARLAALNTLTNTAFADYLRLQPGERVLDVGCGLGILTRQLAIAHPDADLCGIDASAEQLARTVADRPNLRFQQARADALPFAEGTFDVVFCRYLLEHVGDPLAVLREMARVLRPGGRILTQENDILQCTFDPDCPRFDAVWHRFAELQTRLGGDARIGKKLYRLLRQAGFTAIELTIQPEVHHAGKASFRGWVENLLGNVRPSEGLLVAQGLATAEEVQAGLEELRALLTNEFASGYFYWNRASGVKPA